MRKMLWGNRERLLTILFFLAVPMVFGAQPKKNFTPGSNSKLPWKFSNFNEARKALKPILLYVYDGEVQGTNNAARNIEEKILSLFGDDKKGKNKGGKGNGQTNNEFRNVFQDFTWVQIRTGALGWPTGYSTEAVGGASLFIMTCDGNPVGSWGGGKAPSLNEVLQAGRTAAVANLTVAKRLKEKPPTPFVDPRDKADKDLMANADQPANPEPPKDQKLGSLLDPKNNKDEKTGKKDEKKDGNKVVEEEKDKTKIQEE